MNTQAVRRALSLGTLLAVGALQPQALPADSIFWADGGTIRRANLDGSGAEVVAPGAFASGVALDPSAGKVYWTSEGPGKIQRANLDGTGVEELLTGLRQPQGIALDLVGGKVYWTEFFPALRGGRIRCANLDGTGVRELVAGLSFPAGIAVESASAKIYWTELEGRVRRAGLDGTGVEDLTTLSCGAGIALDGPGGKMYLANCGGGPGGPRIQRANLDGSGLEDLFEDLVSTRAPYGIALDLAARKLYWTEPGNPDGGRVRRANLDGTAVENLVAGGSPTGIALLSSAEEPPAPDLPFRRGDSNLDGQVDISDPVHVLLFLFAGGEAPGCEDGADADDSGGIDLSDAIFLLNFLFRGGALPPAPGPADCGADPSPDGLSCERSPGCAPVTSAEVRLLHPEGGERALDLSIFEAPQVEVRITLPAEGPAPAVEVTLESFGASDIDLTPLYGQLAGTRDQTASVAMAPGRHTLSVRVAGEVAARARFLAFDGSTLAILHGPDDPAAVLAPEGEPAAHATTILLAFRDDAQDTAISDFLAAHGLVPFGLLVDRLRPGSPRMVAADVSEHPQGLDPFALAEALNAAAAAGGPLAAAMPDFLLEDDAVAGEHQTQRLRDGAGVNAPAQGYNAANGGYDDSGNTAVDARLLVAGVDELDRAWPAFVRRSHPAFRLAERVLAGGGAAPRPVVAVLDTGFGNGEVNPANPDVAGGGPNANPFLNDVPLARVGIAIPGGGGAVLRAANVTGGVYAAGDPYLQGDNAAFSSRLTDADPALTVRDDPVSLANDTRPHGTNVAIHAAGGGQFVLGGGGDLVDLLPVRHIYDTGVVMIGTEAERPTVWTCVAALLMAANIPEVDVVNASWGVIGDIPVRRLFYEIGLGPLRANGKILVVSAGNDRGRNLSGRVLGAFVPVRGSRHDPSTLNPLAMAVGATTLESAPTGPEVGATITNRGDRVSVTAPGDRLTGVDPYAGAPSYPFATGGTSFAAPQVAGLAALLIRVDENLRGVPAAGALIGRRLEVVEAIEATADDLGTLTPLAFPQVQRYLGDHPGDGPDDVFGFGRINSLKALLTVINGGLPREAPTVQRPGFDGDSNNDTDGDGRHDVFRSLRLRRPVDTAWYGFELRSDERRAQLELDGAPLTDVGAATPDAPTLLTYLGLEAQNFAGAGALKSRLPGLVPKGVDPDAQDRTLGGDYMCTFSLERAYFPFLTSFDDGDGDPATGRRLEITRSAGEKIWSLELLEPLLRRGLVPGVRFDDFVFEITTDRRANEHDHRVSYPAVAASRERVAIAWLDTDETAGPGGMQTIQARLLDANGYEVAAPFRVDQLPAVENAILASPPRLAMTDPADPDQSTFVVVWVQAVPQAATGELVFDLVARAFDAAGNPLGGQFEVDQAQGKKAMLGDCGPSGCFAAIYFKGHDIATRDGGYIVVWSDNRDNLQGEALGTVGVDEGNYNIAGRFLDPQGALAGNRFRLEPPGPDDSAKLLLWPAVAMGPNGGIVAFESDISTPASPALNRIDAVRLDRFGDALGLTLAVSPGAGVEAAVDVAAGPERLLVVWRDETQDTDFQGGPLRGRFFTLEGEPSGEAFRVNDPAGAGQHRIFFGSRPSADATADRFVVTWLSYEDRAGAVYYREYTPLGEPARYDLDYDGQADDLPADIQVDRVPPDAFLHVIDAPQVAARRRVSVRGLVEQRGGNDESFVFIWTDVRRSPQARDAYFVAWRPR